MTLADVAKKAIELGGKYDGHEMPEDINAMTKASVGGARRPGADGRRARQLQARRRHPLVRGRLRGSRGRRRDRRVSRWSTYLAVADVGTVIHPKALGGQVLGRSILGMGHALGQKWVYDQHYGVPLATRFYQNRPPTILDVPIEHAVGGARHSRSGDAGRAQRHRRTAGGGGLLRDPERDFRRRWRRDLPACARSTLTRFSRRSRTASPSSRG